jgi:acetoin utilization deacetylase AcuC-like enzyme
MYLLIIILHKEEYLDDLKNVRWTWRTERSEMPLTREIVEGFRLMAGGTFLATRLAIESGGIGFHIGGGFHHAYPEHAEGFCYINDLAFAVRKGQSMGLFKRALIVDCDLHQGNGTAYIFRNDPEVFTFSIHQENLYPYPKEKSDWDIGLYSFTEDGVYLKELESALQEIYRMFEPEIVLYQAGADPYKEDQLGDLKISMEGLKKRDELVIKMARKKKLPVVITLGGGYAKNFEDTVKIHINTAIVAREVLLNE